jgi:hypothetical protein
MATPLQALVHTRNGGGPDPPLILLGMRRRLLFAASAALAAGVAALLRTSTSPVSASPQFLTFETCGIERWTVKTLQDRPRLLPLRDTTIAFLVSRPAPPSLPATRLPFEPHVYRVHAAVTLVRPEDDGDFHLVLQDPAGRTMIAEAPSSACTGRATPALRREMATARGRVRVCGRADVTGVAFFDFDHGQTGVAPNEIELHPVLAFRCLS